jgi:hypothetical protein
MGARPGLLSVAEARLEPRALAFKTIRRGSNLSGNPSYQIKPDGTAQSNHFRVRQTLLKV